MVRRVSAAILCVYGECGPCAFFCHKAFQSRTADTEESAQCGVASPHAQAILYTGLINFLTRINAIRPHCGHSLTGGTSNPHWVQNTAGATVLTSQACAHFFLRMISLTLFQIFIADAGETDQRGAASPHSQAILCRSSVRPTGLWVAGAGMRPQAQS